MDRQPMASVLRLSRQESERGAMTVRLLHTDGEEDRMNAVGYTRVSTDGQATDGVSLEAQQARIRAWCEARAVIAHGWRGRPYERRWIYASQHGWTGNRWRQS